LDLLEQETDRALEGSATPDYYEQLQLKLQQDVNRLAAMAKNSRRFQSRMYSEGDRAMVKKHHYLEYFKQETDKALLGVATSDYYEQVESHKQQDVSVAIRFFFYVSFFTTNCVSWLLPSQI
jgi:hypothetical protein